ncbi:unnamed protein product [Closterium sp. NIES-54]
MMQLSPKHLLVAACISLLVLSLVPAPVSAAGKAKYNAKAHLTKIRAALKRGGFTTFDKYINSTGFMPILLNVMKEYKLTILAPTNTAFATVSARKDMKTPRHAIQIIGYHFFIDKHSFAELLKYKSGTQFSTLNYRQKIQNLQAKHGQVRLGPKMGAKYVGKIVRKDLYVGPLDVVHGMRPDANSTLWKMLAARTEIVLSRAKWLLQSLRWCRYSRTNNAPFTPGGLWKCCRLLLPGRASRDCKEFPSTSGFGRRPQFDGGGYLSGAKCGSHLNAWKLSVEEHLRLVELFTTRYSFAHCIVRCSAATACYRPYHFPHSPPSFSPVPDSSRVFMPSGGSPAPSPPLPPPPFFGISWTFFYVLVCCGVIQKGDASVLCP